MQGTKPTRKLARRQHIVSSWYLDNFCDSGGRLYVYEHKLEELRSQWALATTLEERKKIAQQIQIVATNDVIYIPWGVWKTPAAMRTNIERFESVF